MLLALAEGSGLLDAIFTPVRCPGVRARLTLIRLLDNLYAVFVHLLVDVEHGKLGVAVLGAHTIVNCAILTALLQILDHHHTDLVAAGQVVQDATTLHAPEHHTERAEVADAATAELTR